jgi:Peptidase M15
MVFSDKKTSRADAVRTGRGMGATIARIVTRLIGLSVALLAVGGTSARADLGETMGSDKFRNAFRGAETVRVVSKTKSGKTVTASRKSSSGSFASAGARSGGVKWVASASCLNASLRAVIHETASRFGSITVSSTCRSPSHNRAVGGAPRSYHIGGNAADFRVHGNASGAAAFLRSRVGGFQNKGGGLFHIDTGPRRPM